MKLVDLISYFRLGGTFEEFCEEQALNLDSEVIEIYAQKPICLDARLGFFPIELTNGKIEILSDGLPYQNLFDFFYFLDVIEEVKNQDGLGDQELAEKLLSYALDDA